MATHSLASVVDSDSVSLFRYAWRSENNLELSAISFYLTDPRDGAHFLGLDGA